MRLIDTSVAIDYLRDHAPAVDLVEGESELGASEVVRFELVAGARPHEIGELEGLFTAIEWQPVDESVARMAGALAARYRAAFGGIDDIDYLIAATALVFEAELLTTNVRHFPMLPGLEPAY